MALHFWQQIERSQYEFLDPDHDFGFSVEQSAKHERQQVPLSVEKEV
jgi:hypothetical protein